MAGLRTRPLGRPPRCGRVSGPAHSARPKVSSSVSRGRPESISCGRPESIGLASERYRIRDDGHVYYLTFSVVEWLPVFVSEAECRVVTDALTDCHGSKALRVNAYVSMPTHLHLILFDAAFDSGPLSNTVTDLRKFLGRRLCDFAAGSCPACLAEVFRVSAGADRARRFWQRTTHPVELLSERFWRQKLDYVHANPVRKGLVTRAEYWRYSSAAYYVSEGAKACEVPLSMIEW